MSLGSYSSSTLAVFWTCLRPGTLSTSCGRCSVGTQLPQLSRQKPNGSTAEVPGRTRSIATPWIPNLWLRRELSARAPSIALSSTADLMREWSSAACIEPHVLAQALQDVRTRALFLPSSADPLRSWWTAASRSAGDRLPVMATQNLGGRWPRDTHWRAPHRLEPPGPYSRCRRGLRGACTCSACATRRCAGGAAQRGRLRAAREFDGAPSVVVVTAGPGLRIGSLMPSWPRRLVSGRRSRAAWLANATRGE